MSLTKLSLAGNNLIIPGQGELVSDIPAGTGKLIAFYSVCSPTLPSTFADIDKRTQYDSVLGDWKTT
jgi:hypothetical protein